MLGTQHTEPGKVKGRDRVRAKLAFGSELRRVLYRGTPGHEAPRTRLRLRKNRLEEQLMALYALSQQGGQGESGPTRSWRTTPSRSRS